MSSIDHDEPMDDLPVTENGKSESNTIEIRMKKDDYNISNPEPSKRRASQVSILSERQQTKLLQFFEDQTLNIQRRYVSRLSPPNGYKNMGELLKDMNKLIDIIWYSIMRSKPLDENNADEIMEEAAAAEDGSSSSHIQMFGQIHHLLSIADNLNDYIEGYGKNLDPEATLKTLKKLDNLFSFLLGGKIEQQKNTMELSQEAIEEEEEEKINIKDEDGDEDLEGGFVKEERKQVVELPNRLTRTEMVRLESIAERARVKMSLACEGMDEYEEGVSKVYEKLLEKIT